MVALLPADPVRPARAWVALGSPCTSVYVPVPVPDVVSGDRPLPLPPLVGDPGVWHRFAALRDAVGSDAAALATVRDEFSLLEEALWEEADDLGSEPGSWASFGLSAGQRVGAALDHLAARRPRPGREERRKATGRIGPMADPVSGSPIPLDDPSGVERILVVTAHPDDVDFGVAGSVATWVKAGIEVAYCIVTDGDAGGSDRTITRPEMATIRRAEQTGGGGRGGRDRRHLPGLSRRPAHLRPSSSAGTSPARSGSTDPQRLVCQSPDRMWDRIGASHPDHLAAGEAAVCAAYPDARNPFAHPELLEEGLEPYAVAEIWMMAAPGTNRVVDVTDTFDRKIAALLCHRSQVGDGEGFEARIREWLSAGARAAGLPDGRLAESFRVVPCP